jgi:general secretion pathway protein G
MRTMEKQLTKRIRRLSKKRGVTLVEVLIVLAIMALISGSAVFLVFPALAKAKLDTAKLSAGVVKQAAQMYIEIDGSDGCPTVDDLVNSRKLEKGKTNDPWGTPYKINCGEGSEIRVISAGKDKKEGTADDIKDNTTKAEIKTIAKL